MIERAKRSCGAATSIKAIMEAVEKYPILLQAKRENENRIHELERQLERVHRLLKSRTELEQEIQALTAQKSLY